MGLLPQDVLVVLKLALEKDRPSYARLAAELGLSASQAHQSVHRATGSGLLVPGTFRVDRRALEEFLVHGLKYVFPARRGPIARGIPTAHSAPPLDKIIVDDGTPLVWPDSEGTVRGETLEPIYKTAPMAARRDPRLYACLALIDAVRAGSARERKLAADKLQELLARAP